MLRDTNIHTSLVFVTRYEINCTERATQCRHGCMFDVTYSVKLPLMHYCLLATSARAIKI